MVKLLARVNVQPGAVNANAFSKVNHALSKVYEDLHSKEKVFVDSVSVIPAIRVKEPNMETVPHIFNVKLVVHVAHVKSILLPARGMSIVTVLLVVKAVAKDTSSCGNGIRPDQFPGVNHEPPEVFVNVCVAGVVNVIHELPPQSPDNPVIAARFQEPAPAPTMSFRSA